MYRIPVEKLYLVDTVQANPPALRRAQRLMAAMGISDPEIITAQASRELRLKRPGNLPHEFHRRTGVHNYSKGWTIVLDTYHEEGWVDSPLMAVYRDGGKQMNGTGICRSAMELHCAFGCFHRCAYCFVDPHFRIACDLESLAQKLPEYFARYPEQKLWKFDNCTDTITLEPEYGASELLVPLFAADDKRYLLLYTKSDNVDHLLKLDHKGHTLIDWSISPLPQSRTIEINTPDTFARIEAMRKCSAAGYTVRARISPIVPLEGWRDDFCEMLDALFSSVNPDLISVDVLGWIHPKALIESMDTSVFEEPFQEDLRMLISTGYSGEGKYLFSHKLRLSVLRHAVMELKKRSPDTPVALCDETPEMWRDLGDLLVMKPDGFACCCGPTSVPGHPYLTPRK